MKSNYNILQINLTLSGQYFLLSTDYSFVSISLAYGYLICLPRSLSLSLSLFSFLLLLSFFSCLLACPLAQLIHRSFCSILFAQLCFLYFSVIVVVLYGFKYFKSFKVNLICCENLFFLRSPFFGFQAFNYFFTQFHFLFLNQHQSNWLFKIG